jgi:hypothetical protein
MTHRYRPRFDVGVAGRRASSPRNAGERTVKDPRRAAETNSTTASPRDPRWDTRPLLDALVELHDPARR